MCNLINNSALPGEKYGDENARNGGRRLVPLQHTSKKLVIPPSSPFNTQANRFACACVCACACACVYLLNHNITAQSVWWCVFFTLLTDRASTIHSSSI